MPTTDPLTTPALPETDPALPVAHRERVAASRRAILDAFDGAGSLALLRFAGNLGDHYIHAGTRRLLAPLQPREVGLLEALQTEADTLAICGGGAWCAAFHELLPRLLPYYERRFGRVIVLPSSFEADVPEVRRALEGSRATFFAREAESWSRIKDLCDARLALDGCFFLDVRPWRRDGAGELLALRGDAEAPDPGARQPPGNRDLSVGCLDLDEWLSTLAAHERITTDRSHVMIAAALLGKTVRYRRSNYFKLPAMVAYALADFPRVTADSLETPNEHPNAAPPPACPASTGPARTEATRERLRRRALDSPAPMTSVAGADRASAAPRVTVGVLVSDHPVASRCLESLGEISIPFDLILADRTHLPGRWEEHGTRARSVGAASVRLLPRGDGHSTVAGRRQIADLATTETVLFLDDDAEIFPHTVEWLVCALDRHPGAAAATALNVLPDGSVQLFGGETIDQGAVLLFTAAGHGRQLAGQREADDPALTSGISGWASGTCTLARRSWLEAEPLDLRFAAYYEDNDWCYRVARAGGTFVRVAESLCLHHQEPKGRAGSALAEILRIQPYLDAITAFYAKHRRILGGLYDLVPELLSPDGEPDVARSRLFLELSAARGGDWRLTQWLAGDLAALLPGADAARLDEGWLGIAARRLHAEQAAAVATAARQRAEISELTEALAQAHAVLAAIERSRIWRLVDRYWRLRRRLRTIHPASP